MTTTEPSASLPADPRPSRPSGSAPDDQHGAVWVHELFDDPDDQDDLDQDDLDPDARLQYVLQVYEEIPLDDGDVVLFVDGRTALEIVGLADRWDDVARSRTAELLHAEADDVDSVVLGIARRGAELRPGDLRLWRELSDDLRGSGITVAPLHALRAA